MRTDVICYGLTRGRDWQQEWYETASKHAGRRAHELRKLGFTVSVGSMGQQVTSVGYVKMTLLTVHGIEYDADVPEPAKVERA